RTRADDATPCSPRPTPSATLRGMSQPLAPLEAPRATSKPADAREFTVRGVVIALFVAALIGASYPYIVLKLGFGPNIAVVSAFFGYLALRVFQRRGALRWESNLAQAAGMTAGNTAFMCTIMAAFDMLS